MSGDVRREPVRVRTAAGRWLDAVAVSGVQGTHRHGRRVHDFPVVLVLVPGHPLDGPLPWPVEDVEAR